MGIYVKFPMTTHQIWSCYVTLASNSDNLYFSPNSILNFRKVTKFRVNWLKNKKLQAKNKLGGLENNPPPSAYRVKARSSIDPIRRLGKLEAFTSRFIFQHYKDNRCCSLDLDRLAQLCSLPVGPANGNLICLSPFFSLAVLLFNFLFLFSIHNQNQHPL